MDLKLKIRDTIKDNELIKEGDRVLLALSGGPDSMCLLHILNDLQHMLKFELGALHLNHMIRGKEADADEAFLIEHCRQLGIKLYVEKVDVLSLSRERGRSLEETGRDVRYEKLRAKLRENNTDSNAAPEDLYDKIAVAHNKNDQAETVLMRIIRGTGVKGLCGMDYKKDDIIRPLLDTGRPEIEAYCKANSLKPRFDKTNGETEYTRNKVRLELLPYLAGFNPNIIDSLVRLADSARDNEKNEFAKVVTTAFSEAGLKEDIGAVHINSLYKASRKNIGGKIIEFPHGYKAVIKSGKIYIQKPES